MASRSAAHDEAERILTSVRQLIRAMRVVDRKARAQYGLSSAQMFILHALQQEEDSLTLNELAERTATDQSSASVVVQRLVEEGYVTRSPRKADRRHVELRLTAKGRTAIRRTPPPAQQKILSTIERMPPADRRKLAELMERFVANVAFQPSSSARRRA